MNTVVNETYLFTVTSAFSARTFTQCSWERPCTITHRIKKELSVCQYLQCAGRVSFPCGVKLSCRLHSYCCPCFWLLGHRSHSRPRLATRTRTLGARWLHTAVTVAGQSQDCWAISGSWKCPEAIL